MVDLVGNFRSTLDNARQWGEYFGEVDNRAQNRWQQAEARRRYDEQNRATRAEAVSYADFMAQNQGQFSDMAPMLAGLRPQEVPAATATGASAGLASAGDVAQTNIQASANAAPQASRQAPVVDPRADLAEPIEQRQYTRQELARNPQLARRIQEAANRGEVVIGNLAGGSVMVYPRTGSPANTPHVGPLFFPRGNPSDVGGGFGVGIDPRFTAGHLGMRPLTRQQVEIDATTDPMVAVAGLNSETTDPNAPTVDPSVDLAETPTGAPAAGLTATETTVPGVATTNTALDPYYQGANDTSRGLQPTREMQLLQVTIRDNLRRAELAAAHGQLEVAQQAFGQALQGQAAMLQQSRMVIFRAASAGSLDAMATLLEEFHGYPEGTVRLQPTDERRTRFNLQIQNNTGQWVSASEVPRTREEIMGGLLNLVDAEGAAARTEANTELMRANIAAGADIEVATIAQRTAVFRALTDVQLAQMNNSARAQLQNGQGSLELDRENGVAWFHYSTTDSEGNLVPGIEMLRLEDQPGPSTNGRGRTGQMPTRTIVTGVTGVEAN